MASKKAILIGPPGVGKTLVFKNLVGRRSVYSTYYPGTEIKVFRGSFNVKKENWELIDPPSIWNFNPISLNEEIVLNLFLQEKPDLVLQVVTPETMQQSLMLSIQLSEMGIPFLILINKRDAIAYSDFDIDMGRFYSLFHAHLVVVSMILGHGIKQVKKLISEQARPRWVGQFEGRVTRGLENLERVVDELDIAIDYPFTKRFVILMIFLKNKIITKWFKKQIGLNAWKVVERNLDQSKILQWSKIIQKTWQETAQDLAGQVVERKSFKNSPLLSVVNKYVIHPFWGTLIFLIVLVIIFFSLSKFAAGFIVGFLETEIFSKYITPGFVSLVSQFPLAPFLKNMLIGDFGLLTMGLTYLLAVIFPIVFILFALLAILEDSGYLSNLAVLLNRFFAKIGLIGSAIPVFFMGLGCSVLAVTKARCMQTSGQNKAATFLVVLAVPCIAQLGIIINMLSVIPFAYAIIFLLVMFLQFFLIGNFLKRIIPEVQGGLIEKIVPLRIPRIKNVLSKLWLQIIWYFRLAIPFFALATVFLYLAEATGFLELLQRLLAPLVTYLLGLPVQSVEVFVLGFFRRDYGAARLYEMTNDGSLNAIQVLVSLLVITISVPCIAVFFNLIKEHGWKLALSIGLAIFFYSFALGSFINLILSF